MKEAVYEPSEDTFLMEKALPKNLTGKRVLEVGCGRGFLSVECALRGGKVTAVDINENALNAAERLAVLKGVEVDLIESNLFEKVEGKFDLILFNPPYVDSCFEGLDGEHAWAGGKKGREVIDKFLKEFKNYLNKEGVCLLLISSINEMKQELEEKGWIEIEKTRLMDGEELFVMRFVHN